MQPSVGSDHYIEIAVQLESVVTAFKFGFPFIAADQRLDARA
jgi:hypothetical protein